MGALGALICGIISLIVGIDGDTRKLGVSGWFTGGTVAGLVVVLMYKDDAAAARRK
ncbi:MAG: hypothetical protein OSB75_11980 [Dehalococcoidia bacterium]|nr:hypothetical protein [Dehalococcoidia bacterium]